MRQYIRAAVPGATYFFTLTLQDRGSSLLIEHVDKLRRAVAHVKARHPFCIDAMVVLPEHLHAIWTLPPGDGDYSTRWMLIKGHFSRGLDVPGRGRRGEVKVWQRRFWEHLVRDEDDFARHVDYIHFNPVKHGYVTRAGQWRHSSFHRYVKDGRLPAGWGVAAGIEGSFGE